MSRTIRAAAAALAAASLAAGTALGPALEPRDAEALAVLADVAGPTSGVPAEEITATECWLPSDHVIDDPSLDGTTWRVLCRAHYVDADGADRYQDTTCVGDFAAEPMLEHCYRWTYYTGMPQFEDEPAASAG